jgi:hypothetical protein
MKLTRRQMVGATVAGSAVAVKAIAQVGAPVNTAAPDFAKQARDNMQRNADTLAKFAVPITTEPAFQFKA